MFRRIGGRFESFQHFGMGSMCGIRSVYKGSKYYHTEIGKYLASLDGQGYGRLKNLEGTFVKYYSWIESKLLISRENLEFCGRIIGV